MNLIKQLEFWKNKEFLQDINEIKEELKKVGHRCYIFNIKNNLIDDIIPVKDHWKDGKKLKLFKDFVNKILNKVQLNDCFLVVFLCENHNLKLENELFPYFVIHRYLESNLLLFPDLFFLENYDFRNRLQDGSLNKFIEDLNNETSFSEKKDKIIFRSWNRKYFPLGKNRNEHYDINSQCGGCPTPKEEQHLYKYHLALYQRWDTFYYNLLSNSLAVIVRNTQEKYSAFNYETFYIFYIQDGIHYISCELQEVNSIIDKIIKLPNIETIVENSVNLKSILSYENILNDYCQLFLEYSKMFE